MQCVSRFYQHFQLIGSAVEELFVHLNYIAMKLSIVGFIALIVFITAQPEVQLLMFAKYSKEYTIIGFCLFFSWMALTVFDTVFNGIDTPINKELKSPASK